MSWDNYLNMVIQPVTGGLSDRTNTRFGRRKPWLLAGVPLAALGFVAIPHFYFLAGIVVAILLFNLGMAVFNSPTLALLGDLFPPGQRSKANGVIHLMGGIGVIVALIGGGILYDLGREMPFIFGSLLMVVAISVVLIRVKETTAYLPVQKELPQFSLKSVSGQIFDRRHRPTVMLLLAVFCSFLAIEATQTWLSSFGKFTLGIEPGRLSLLLGASFVLSTLLFAVPSGLIATNFGRKRTMLAGLTGMAILFAGGWFVQKEVTLVGLLVMAGISLALVNVNALPMIYEVGSRTRIGILTGLYHLTTNAAAALGPQVTGVWIDLTGKNYRMMFVVSAIFMMLAVLFLSRVQETEPILRSEPSL